MDLRDETTPLVLTYDEAPNIGRSLARLAWAPRVLVVDSGSRDETLAIAGRYANVEVICNPFCGHAQQWNFGIARIATRWVLALDADYVLGPGFEQELGLLRPLDEVAYFARFRYLVRGRPLRGSLYPPRAVLFRRDSCEYVQDGHTQILRFCGASSWLRTRIDHDDRKPLIRWLASQIDYADLEVDKLLAAPPGGLRLQDRLRKTGWAAVPLAPLYALLARGAILDGPAGAEYALQRLLAEAVLALRLAERRTVAAGQS